jgi:hypothetical protein
MMRMLAGGLDCPVAPVEEAGLDGDMLEAQAFAYLAVRVARGLADLGAGHHGGGGAGGRRARRRTSPIDCTGYTPSCVYRTARAGRATEHRSAARRKHR